MPLSMLLAASFVYLSVFCAGSDLKSNGATLRNHSRDFSVSDTQVAATNQGTLSLSNTIAVSITDKLRYLFIEVRSHLNFMFPRLSSHLDSSHRFVSGAGGGDSKIYHRSLSMNASDSTVVRGNGKAIFLLKDNVRHHIPDWDTFLSLGFKASDIKVVDLTKYELGPPIEVINVPTPKSKEELTPKLYDHFHNNSEEVAKLNSTLSKVAGLYVDETRITDSIRKVVLVTGCNYGFLNHLHNFKCFVDRLGLKFLVLSLDKKTFDYISTKTNMTTFLWSGDSDVTEESTEFRSRGFNVIVKRKKHAVFEIIKLGYDVLFSDTDVVMTRDPMPYLQHKNVDYVFSINHICPYQNQWSYGRSRLEGNTGFYYVRSNERTLQIWINSFDAMDRNHKFDDQAIFWSVLRSTKNPPVRDMNKCEDNPSAADNKYFTICPLDICLFNSGMLRGFWDGTYELLVENLKKRNQTMVALHANYLSGNAKKEAALESYGLWLATQAEDGSWGGTCKILNPANATYLIGSP